MITCDFQVDLADFGDDGGEVILNTITPTSGELTYEFSFDDFGDDGGEVIVVSVDQSNIDTVPFKPLPANLTVNGKLNKSQLKEFAASGISQEYAQINFFNITKKYTERLMQCESEVDRRIKGTALLGGWSDYALSTLKPKQPRVCKGKVIKYESLGAPKMIEVRHPEGVEVSSSTAYVVEGFKKAVCVAEQSKCQTYAFNGLSIGINLIEVINRLQGDIRVIFDNDNSIAAVDTARSFVAQLRPNVKVAQFKNYKGVDDAYMAGISISDIQFVDKKDWVASYSGYITGDSYEFNSRKFHDIYIPSSKKLICIQGAKSTGKTWIVENKVRIGLDDGRKIVAATHRRTLSRANARRLNIRYIDDTDYQPGDNVSLVDDSLLKLKVANYAGAIVFLDEVVQQIEHLFFSATLKKKRALIWQRFCELLQFVQETSGQVYIADADLDNKSQQLIKTAGNFSDDEVFIIRNTHVVDRGTAYFSIGVPIEDKGTLNYPTDILKVATEAISSGEKVWICCSARDHTSKFGTICLEQYYLDLGIKPDELIRIDADTVADPKHAAFKAAERITEICAKYRVFLVSPTLATGADIQARDFDKIFSLQSGTQRADSARQAPERIRDTMPIRVVYAPERLLWKKDIFVTNPSEMQLYQTAHDEALKVFSNDWFEEVDENNRNSRIQAVQDYFLKHQKEAYIEKHQYAQKIVQGMIADGYTVEILESDITIEESATIFSQLAEISDELTNGHRISVNKSEKITAEIAETYYAAESNTKEEKQQLEAYQIRKQLNIEPTVEVQEALDNGKKEQLENQFAALQGFELKKELWQRDHFWSAGREGSKELASDLVKRSGQMLQIQALKAVKFFEIIQEEFSTDDARDLLAEIIAKPLNLRLFNLPQTIATKYAIKTLKDIAGQFNFEIQYLRRIKGGQRIYKAFDLGFALSDGTNLKSTVLQHFTEKATKSVNNWHAFQADFHAVKKGALLDKTPTAKLSALTDEYKYAKLSTRARTLGTPPTEPDFKFVKAETLEEFKQWLTNLSLVALDVETYGLGKKGGLSHLIGQMRLIQFASADAIWIIEQSNFDLCNALIKDVLLNANIRKVGHNIMFDLRFLRIRFDVVARNCADTMLGSKSLMGDMGAGQITKHSLAQACENFLGLDVDKSEQASDWSVKELSNSQVKYAAKDPWLTYFLYLRLVELTKDPSLLLLPMPKMMAWEAWEIENRFLFAAQKMEQTGYEIDLAVLASTKAKYESVRDELQAQWTLPFAPTQTQKVRDYLNIKYNLSLVSIGKASAAKHTDKPELLLMQQIKACNAILHQLEMITAQVIQNNGRTTTVFKTLSGTGRTATGAANIDKSILNLQSLAARVNPVLKKFDLPKLKALFKTHLIIDLPASHGRISAELSNDENHLSGFIDTTVDMHCVTAAAVAEAVFPEMGYTAEWIKANKDTDPIAKGLRDTAKNTYYGWLNGAGVNRIKEQISSNLQIEADLTVCKKALEGLQNVFKQTTLFAKQLLKDLEEHKFVVNGIVCGWMEFAGTYLCWRLGAVGKDFKVPATKAFAGIWSRTESLLMKRSCIRVAEKFDEMPEWNSHLQNFIHDEINCEIGNPEAAEFAHAVVHEEFGKVCPRTIGGFDSLTKCYPLQNWSQK